MKKTIVGCVVFMLVIGFVFGQSQYKQVKMFGVASLKKGGVHSEQELKNLFTEEKEATAVALDRREVLIKAFFEQMPNIIIRYQEFPAGSRFLSMTYRSWDNKIKNTGPWEWAGKDPFKGYVVIFESSTERRWLIIPEICGNIGLWKIEKIEPKVELPKEIPIPEKVVIEPKPEPTPIVPEKPIIPKPKVNYFVGAGAGMFYSCFMEYITAEVGAERYISKSTSVRMSIGIGVPVGKEDGGWKTTPIFGFGLQSKLLDLFCLGVEVGVSGKMKDGLKTQLEFGGEMGFYINNNISVYVRGRVPFNQEAWNYKILGGFRFSF